MITVRLLVASVVVQAAGQVYDARWHAAHEELEKLAQQLEAHWPLWTGWLAALAVAGTALVRRTAGDRGSLMAVVGAGLFLVAVSVWHTVEHERDRDPELPHLLLAAGQLAMVVAVTAAWWRTRMAPERRPG